MLIESSFMCNAVSADYVREVEFAIGVGLEFCDEGWDSVDGCGYYYCKFKDGRNNLFMTFYFGVGKVLKDYFPDVRIDGVYASSGFDSGFNMVMENRVGEFLTCMGADEYFEDIFLNCVRSRCVGCDVCSDVDVGGYSFRLICCEYCDVFTLFIDVPNG